METVLETELLWVYENFEFSVECTEQLKNKMISQGFVEDIEGSYVVTDLGESVLGLSVEDERGDYEHLEEVDLYD